MRGLWWAVALGLLIWARAWLALLVALAGLLVLPGLVEWLDGQFRTFRGLERVKHD